MDKGVRKRGKKPPSETPEPKRSKVEETKGDKNARDDDTAAAAVPSSSPVDSLSLVSILRGADTAENKMDALKTLANSGAEDDYAAVQVTQLIMNLPLCSCNPRVCVVRRSSPAAGRCPTWSPLCPRRPRSAALTPPSSSTRSRPSLSRSHIWTRRRRKRRRRRGGRKGREILFYVRNSMILN